LTSKENSLFHYNCSSTCADLCLCLRRQWQACCLATCWQTQLPQKTHSPLSTVSLSRLLFRPFNGQFHRISRRQTATKFCSFPFVCFSRRAKTNEHEKCHFGVTIEHSLGSQLARNEAPFSFRLSLSSSMGHDQPALSPQLFAVRAPARPKVRRETMVVCLSIILHRFCIDFLAEKSDTQLLLVFFAMTCIWQAWDTIWCKFKCVRLEPKIHPMNRKSHR